MAKFSIVLVALIFGVFVSDISNSANTVPTEVQMPGSQPADVVGFVSPSNCANCHSNYNNATTAAAGEGEPQHEPSTGWAGGAMANAGRDPIFWAALAIAEQDFDGSGDLCVRCHSTTGWYEGRSTPTDGSGLASTDSDGVDCEACHKMTNPDNTELLGVMNSPFTANCSDDPIDATGATASCGSAGEGYYGSGMTSIWLESERLGPYLQTTAKHADAQSLFHRDVDFCGSCHDVSNPIVGDLAPGNGSQHGAPHAVSSQDFHAGVGNLGGSVTEKAAFNNPPYAYGTSERTFSEYKASALPTTKVSDFSTLPLDLRKPGGSLEVTYQAALATGQGGDYADGTTRFFSCQSCHMRPTNSKGAKFNSAIIRPDLPQHDHTGGNYWLVDMIKYQDSQGHLRLGGGVTATQITALDLGQQRAVQHLTEAASLNIESDTLKVVNLTGHKLISGYPEGRRMWLNIKWYDTGSNLLREDGAYGPLVDGDGAPVMVANPAGGVDVQVESILNLEDPNTRVYDAHNAITKEWAETLLTTGKPEGFVLGYDRYTGDAIGTLGMLADQAAGTYEDTFHFALNNFVSKDTRIPPYGMSYDIAKKRNALPVPANQYGTGTAGSTYSYWDEVDLDALKPSGATSAVISLYYQGTSWEYVQFLNEANDGQNVFLGEEGANMLEAWVNAEVPVAIKVAGDRKMVPPVEMATAFWGAALNLPPVAVDDSFATTPETELVTAAPGVLGNDTDENIATLSATLVTDVSNGVLTLAVDGSFSYLPNSGFIGVDSFTYQANDGLNSSNIGIAEITVSEECSFFTVPLKSGGVVVVCL